MTHLRPLHIPALSGLIIGLTLIGCANRGIGPQGGPKDETPPALQSETPANGTLHFDTKRIEIAFDEYIQLTDVSNQVMVSPPQQMPPEIKALGKKIRIEFKQPLQDSTTYTIDFGSAIVDNNEKNPLPGYTYSFSTGDYIDSLEIYGTMINAEDLNPISGVLVGYHSNPADSAFSTQPFLRIGKTDAQGDFSIKNIPPGTYRLFGLKDMSRDYMYQPGEGLAWLDTLITPYIHQETEQDTIFLRDTLAADSSLIPDSIITSTYYYYEPSNLLLYYFQENKQRHYFQRALREKAHCFQLLFSAPQDSMPLFEALRLPSDSLGQDTTWVDVMAHSLITHSSKRDTITFFLTDSSAIRMDSICLRMTYMCSDSIYNLYPRTDTIFAVYRAPRMSEKQLANQRQKEANTPLTITLSRRSTVEIYDTLYLSSSTPLTTVDTKGIHLEVKKDTSWLTAPLRCQLRDSVGMSYWLHSNLSPGMEYRLTIDSGAIADIYGKANLQTKFAFKVRKQDEYASLKVQLLHFDPRAMIVLLNDKDQPVRTLPAMEQGTLFQYLEPKTYYLRMYLDLNGDHQWTTGDWLLKRQPEPVYYYTKKLNLRANWDFEEQFDWQGVPLLDQKPEAIRKDAATVKKK